MYIRTATMDDLDKITAVEAACFPPEEAAKKEEFAGRLNAYPEHFWLLEEGGELIAFIDGMVTDDETICDEMFEDASRHRESGKWQAIFGVNTLPGYRRKGYAASLMEQVILDARRQGRKGVILTCKEEMIPFYEAFGYQNQGISSSVHGGAVWYDMMLRF